jgi:sialic acid synthase SpsE
VSEVGNRFPMRKSLMAARDIAQGRVVEEADIALMRPESGDLPEHYWAWQGRTAPRAYSAGDPLSVE